MMQLKITQNFTKKLRAKFKKLEYNSKNLHG